MSSLRKIEANRRNAMKSTGPRTDQGKARSAQNARKEGYTAEVMVLSVEEHQVFDKMHQDFTDQYQPLTICEEQYVFEMAWARWRMHRIWNAEKSHLERAMENACIHQTPDPQHTAALAIGDEIDKMDKFARYEQRLTRQFNKAKANLLEAQELREARELAEREAQERADREAAEAQADGKNEATGEPFDGEFTGYPIVPLEPAKPYLLESLGRNDLNHRTPENTRPEDRKNEPK